MTPAIAIDTETFAVTEHEPVPRLVSVAIAGPDPFLYHHSDPILFDVLRWALSERVCAFAQAPFDVFALLRWRPDLLPYVVQAYVQGRIRDVATREKLIDIAEGQYYRRGQYNLGAIAERRAGLSVDKEFEGRTRFGDLYHVPIERWPADARAYAIGDAVATYATFVEQERFRSTHALDVFADEVHQAQAHLPLYEQTLRGMHTDQTQVDKVDRRLADEITRLAIVLMHTGLARVGGTKKAPKIVRNRKAAAELLEQYARATGQTLTRTAPTAAHPLGQVTMSEDALLALRIPEGHPLDAYRRYGSLQALRTKNVPVLRHPIVRTRYEEIVESGRTSSSAPGDPFVGSNLQNQPREGGFRECLVPPDESHAFVISDFGMAELVALAQVQIDLFGSSALGSMLAAGRDPHAEFGCSVAGIPIEAFDKKNPAHKAARQSGKAWNFGKPGGMGRARFIAYAQKVYGVTVTPEQERAFTRQWHATFPEMRMFFDYVQSLTGPGGWISIVQPRSRRIRGMLRFPEACNTHFQGLAADFAKTALWMLWLDGLDPGSPLYVGGPPVDHDTGRVPASGGCLFVHDENVRVCRREHAEAVRDRQEQIMIRAARQWCPDVPISVDSTIAKCYGK